MDNFINIFLILLLIDVGIRILLKKKSNTLNCGVFAWAGVSVKSFNEDKFNLLGVFNESRGTDSCGVSIDGDIFLGVDTEKKFRSFVNNRGYDSPVEIPIVIGHTRNGPINTYTIDNAHPFGFGESTLDKDKFAFIGVHNGTLYNYEALAEKYKVSKVKNKTTSYNYKQEVKKIDSEILLEIIYNNKDFKVLSEYNGAAALIFYNVNEPNTIYCFHGASSEYSHIVPTEERPLYAYQEHKNSLYLSSQEEGLEFIGGDKDTITSLDTNIVYKIKNGNLKTAEKISISRIAQQSKKKVQSSYASQFNLYDDDYYGQWPRQHASYPVHDAFKKAETTSVFCDTNIFDDVSKQTKGGKIYLEKLRYHRNGHLITGVYVWIRGIGFYLVGNNRTNAEKTFLSLLGKSFYEDEFVPSNIKNKPAGSFVPFTKSIGFTADTINFNNYFYYFYEGVRVKGLLDFNACANFKILGHNCSIAALSNAASHPIMDYTAGKSKNNNQGIFYNGVLADGSFCPLGSTKRYKIKNGNCEAINDIFKDKHNKTAYSNTLSKVKAIIEEKEVKRKKEAKVIQLLETTSSANKKVEDLVVKIFTPFMEKAQSGIEKLTEFIDTDLGNEAIDTLTNFLIEGSELTESEVYIKK